MATDRELDALTEFVGRHSRLLVLTGAGVSTGSGIPAYRDRHGKWRHRQPIQHQAFLCEHAVRRRYWARSLVGWPVMGRARPNAAHRAFVALERADRLQHVVTQNVDRLHQRAGSVRVVDLHGRIDRVVCMACDARQPRALLQEQLAGENSRFAEHNGSAAPDGDADLDDHDLAAFVVPACPRCGGILKPDVVFYGDNVPRQRVAFVQDQLAQADALLVVATSLTVFSGFRFCRFAAQQGLPMAAVNLGRTRADDMLSCKVDRECGAALSEVVARLGAESPIRRAGSLQGTDKQGEFSK